MKTVAKFYPETLKETVTSEISFTLLKRFSLWCEKQEGFKCFILAAFIAIQGCIVVPVTLLVTSFIDLGLAGVAVAVAVTGTVGVLVSNISEIPMKYIFAIFFLNLIANFALIAFHILAIL